MKRITLQRQVFEKEKYLNTIDNSFKELKSEPDPNFFDRDLAVLSDFWYLYEKFFYNIPKLGVIESHEYLLKLVVNLQTQNLFQNKSKVY